ncbi:MAG: hypothetical protein U0270_43145 [Labilithrix sp.]
MRRVRSAFLLSSLSLAVAAACGSSEGSGFNDPNGTSGGLEGGASSSSGGLFDPGDGGGGEGGNPIGQPITIEPTDQILTINVGDPAPTIQFKAKIKATGQEVPASWTIDRGELGSISLTTGLFTASTNVGGKAIIQAVYEGQAAQTSVTIKLKSFQNGSTEPPPDPDAGTGAGGLGGVGGDGPGGKVDQATIDRLHGATETDNKLAALYPYDGTVWPRGILPPLLMWQPGDIGHYKAVMIKLSETNFEYEGVFASNSPTDNFKNYQIPQAAWKQLLQSNGGEEVSVSITLATADKAFGPLTMKWKVASAPLKGIVYYNSYGTKLAKNYDGALPDVPGQGKGRFGGATLGVRGGSTEPVLVAGSTGDSSKCRVCHSVAANGSLLITQQKEAGDRKFSTYDLKQAYPNGETPMLPEGASASYAWSAIYPDGSMFLNDSSSAAGSTDSGSFLWKTVSGTAPATPEKVTTTGWPSGLRAAYPAFSPDGKALAFTMFTGAPAGKHNEKTLGYLPFDKTTSTWGPMKTLFDSDTMAALYPAFLPTNDAVVFELEVEANGRDYGGTRGKGDSGGNADIGARGQLYWTQTTVDGTPIATELARLNGTGYLPEGPNGHTKAVEPTLNYEPTVNPVPSGGYAWVVFTSRRMYGNVATINPWHSDPRYHDISVDPTPKKLWVAAIDLNAAPGTDPSHPAFYLPAQELLAGNSRGYWVVDPCKSDGNSCESGDECCGGYCRPNGENKLVCSNVVPKCAQEFESCKTSSDCCNNPNYLCINNRCALPGPVK